MAQVTDLAALNSALDTLKTAVDAVVAAAADEVQESREFMVSKTRAIGAAEQLARLTRRGTYNRVRSLEEHT